MEKEPTNFALLWSLFWNNFKYALAGRWRVVGRHLPPGQSHISKDYFGICIATAEDEAVDDYIINCLNDLNITCVRLDLTYSGENAHAERILERLLTEKFKVCLHLVQPFEEARAMNTPESKNAWRSFIARILDRYGNRIEMVEIGSTINRRNWAGYRPATFMTAWLIAHEEVSKRGVTLAGPNITDFEPLYNIGTLGLMRKWSVLPNIHSDNLFAERAAQPEAFDHKVMGHLLAPVIKYNLIKKARTLAQIGNDFGVPQTICTHVSWNLRRIGRYLADTEEKQADYVARYCCLAAASGSLERVYWGSLINLAEGLIDDSIAEYPKIPLVTLYEEIPGDLSAYRPRPAFDAFRTAIKFIAGAAFRRTWASARGLEIHEFITGDTVFHVVWTTNGNCAEAAEVYSPAMLTHARAFNRNGRPLDDPPEIFTESPVYLFWPDGTFPTATPGATIMPGIRVHNRSNIVFRTVRQGIWEGMCALHPEDDGPIHQLLPDVLEQAKEKNIMRNRRNCVWSMPHPYDPSRTIVVKRIQVRRLNKKLIQLFRRARAVRKWNSANELLRRGIPTPLPIAFFYQHGRSGIADSYFIYEMFETAGSVRQAFAALAGGDSAFNGITADKLFSHLAEFLYTMHGRGAFFRDLSPGNILIGADSADGPRFCLIDTGRPRFFNRPLSMQHRLRDLCRLAHKLDWNGRNKLLSTYLNEMGRKPVWWMKAAFLCYDLKRTVKHKLPRKRLAPRKTRP